MLDNTQLKKIMDYVILQYIERVNEIKMLPELEASEDRSDRHATLVRKLKGCKLILRQPNNIIDDIFDRHKEVSHKFRKILEDSLLSSLYDSGRSYKYDSTEIMQFSSYYDMLAINAFDILCMMRDIFVKSHRNEYFSVDMISSKVNDIKLSMTSVVLNVFTYGELVKDIIIYQPDTIPREFLEAYETFINIYIYFLHMYKSIEDIDNEYKLGISDLISTFGEYIKMSTTMEPGWGKSALSSFESEKMKNIRLDELPRLNVENTILYGKESY